MVLGKEEATSFVEDRMYVTSCLSLAVRKILPLF